MKTHMKTILILLTLFIFANGYSLTSDSLLAIPTHTKTVKSKRGLFGYKYVHETRNGDAALLACSEPGFKKCAWTNPQGIGVLTAGQLDEISEHVDALILANPINGTYIYANDYLVIYTLGVTISDITIEILTRSEAADRGYTI
jgi:hypothetical protein